MIAGTKEEHENNGFDLFRYTAAFSVMMLHYSSYCMILSRNLPTQASAVMSRARHIAFAKHKFVMLYRIQDDAVIVDGMFHELQAYEGILRNELHLQ